MDALPQDFKRTFTVMASSEKGRSQLRAFLSQGSPASATVVGQGSSVQSSATSQSNIQSSTPTEVTPIELENPDIVNAAFKNAKFYEEPEIDYNNYNNTGRTPDQVIRTVDNSFEGTIFEGKAKIRSNIGNNCMTTPVVTTSPITSVPSFVSTPLTTPTVAQTLAAPNYKKRTQKTKLNLLRKFKIRGSLS